MAANDVFTAIDRTRMEVLWFGSDIDSCHRAMDTLAAMGKFNGEYHIIVGPMLGGFKSIKEEIEYEI